MTVAMTAKDLAPVTQNIICETFSHKQEGDEDCWFTLYKDKTYAKRYAETTYFGNWVKSTYNKSPSYRLFVITKPQMPFWNYCVEKYNLKEHIYYQSRDPVINKVHPSNGPFLTMFILFKPETNETPNTGL